MVRRLVAVLCARELLPFAGERIRPEFAGALFEKGGINAHCSCNLVQCGDKTTNVLITDI